MFYSSSILIHHYSTVLFFLHSAFPLDGRRTQCLCSQGGFSIDVWGDQSRKADINRLQLCLGCTRGWRNDSSCCLTTNTTMTQGSQPPGKQKKWLCTRVWARKDKSPVNEDRGLVWNTAGPQRETGNRVSDCKPEGPNVQLILGGRKKKNKDMNQIFP